MSAHPEGMPEFCDPSGVGGRLLDRRPGGVAALDLRLLSGKPSAWPGSDREPNLEGCIAAERAAREHQNAKRVDRRAEPANTPLVEQARGA